MNLKVPHPQSVTLGSSEERGSLIRSPPFSACLLQLVIAVGALRAFLSTGGSVVLHPHYDSRSTPLDWASTLQIPLWSPKAFSLTDRNLLYCKPKSPNLDRHDGLGRRHH